MTHVATWGSPHFYTNCTFGVQPSFWLPPSSSPAAADREEAAAAARRLAADRAAWEGERDAREAALQAAEEALATDRAELRPGLYRQVDQKYIHLS